MNDWSASFHCFLPYPSAQLGSDKYQFFSHWFDSTRVRTCEVRIARSPTTGDGCSTHSTILSNCSLIDRHGSSDPLLYPVFDPSWWQKLNYLIWYSLHDTWFIHCKTTNNCNTVSCIVPRRHIWLWRSGPFGSSVSSEFLVPVVRGCIEKFL